MAGISSGIGKWYFAKQTAKGTPNVTPTVVLKAAGAPSLAPAKNRQRYPATDVGRDQGPSYTASMTVAGDIPLLWEPAAAAFFWHAVLGSTVDSGTNPNYTHTTTPANDLPYYTVTRMVGGVVTEQYVDCKIGRLALEGAASTHWTMTLGVAGVKSVWVTDPGTSAIVPQGYLFPEIKGTFKVDTVAQVVHRISIEVQNNASGYFADDYIASDVDVAKREISLSAALRFTGATAFPKYREYFYGSDAGTELSPVTGTHAVEFEAVRNANLSSKVAFPVVTYAGVPVQMDPGGDPIEIDLACNVETPSGGTPIMTTTTKDQVATV